MTKRIFLLSLLLVCSVVLIFVAYVFDHQIRPDYSPPVTDSVPYIEVYMDEDTSLVGGVVEEWMNWEVSAADLFESYRSSGQTYSVKTLAVQWSVFDIPDGSFIRKQLFELATEKDFHNAVQYDLRAGERKIELQNLLVDTVYYFRITLQLENDGGCVAKGQFKTKWSPRLLDFEQLNNVRDIGGWKTEDNKSIRQGLLYRGCELDGATIKQYQITKPGVTTMVEELDIKSELDLRSSEVEGVRNMLGSGVRHSYFDVPSYAGIFTEDGNAKIKEVFSALAVQENYPAYLHCTNGIDRTGIVCYLLQALLGVSEEDCYREWELSVLSTGGGKYGEMDRFVEKLNEQSGATLQQRTENYLLSIGVTHAQIESIRSILIA